jgi:hypothetical protein
VEDTISTVELATLQGQCANTVWPDPDEKVEDNGRGGVMGTEVIFAE